ncbi:hypothetical protein V1512DRAFT_200111 [Lipomyces arxii]|uniref:uncharacterized protein n=1 Tax=Lipomyces arxii TaxID=56418 RepID=UPI0034CF796A
MQPLVFDPASAAEVLRTTTFPRSGEPNDPKLMSYIERTVMTWQLRGRDRLQATSISEFLYKAVTKTYHSHVIFRCLMKVLPAVGNYVDAERALEVYLDLAEKGRIRSQKGSAFVDSDDAITTVETAADGVQLIVQYTRDAAKAKSKAEVLRGWIVIATASKDAEESSKAVYTVPDEASARILNKAWTAVGSAYVLAARASLNNGERKTDANMAKESFETAISFYSNNAETHYEYSLLLAEFFRDLPAAEDSCRRSLQINPTHIGSAHVLALSLSAREKYDEAREVCLAVVNDTLGEQRRRVSLADKRAIVQVRMTEVALIEASAGVQSALEAVSDSLFNVYNDLFTWDDDTVESQIHEASTSAMAFPVSPEKSTERIKKRNDIVPAISVPDIALNEGAQDEDFGDDQDDDDYDALGDSQDFKVSPSPKSPAPGPARRWTTSAEKLILDKIPQDLVTNTANIPAAMLADLRLSSPRPRGLLSKKNLILPRSIRRRLSDASMKSKKSTKSALVPITAASIIEKNKGGANRVLRNSISVDDAELRAISMQCLREIWLVLAGLFRRSERWTECATAIAEATKLGVAREDTFSERGFLMQAQGRIPEALEAFESALTVSIDYVPAIIGISAILVNLSADAQPVARDRAFVLLETTTKLEGWDSSEAWMLLGDVYDSIGSTELVREAWWRAAELEETRPVRRFSAAWIWDAAQ